MPIYDEGTVCDNREIFRVNIEVVWDNLDNLKNVQISPNGQAACTIEDMNKWLDETEVHLDAADISPEALAVFIDDKTAELNDLIDCLLRHLPQEGRRLIKNKLHLAKLHPYK